MEQRITKLIYFSKLGAGDEVLVAGDDLRGLLMEIR